MSREFPVFFQFFSYAVSPFSRTISIVRLAFDPLLRGCAWTGLLLAGFRVFLTALFLMTNQEEDTPLDWWLGGLQMDVRIIYVLPPDQCAVPQIEVWHHFSSSIPGAGGNGRQSRRKVPLS